MPNRVRTLGLAICVAALLPSCDNGTGPTSQSPATLQKVSGDEQEGVVGEQLSNPLVVRVVNADGDPVRDAQVSFVVTSGGGSVPAGSIVTNGSGLAQRPWTLGTSTSADHRVEARLVDATGEPIATEVFTATPLPDAPALLVKVEGEGQQATVGEPVQTIPVVAVGDQHENPVPGVTVTFQVTAGGGTIQNATATTDEDGLASVGRWTLGTVVEPQSLRASVSGLTPVVFTLTPQSGPGVQFVIEGTPPTTATSGAPFGPIVVRLRDPFGNVVPLALIGVTASLVGSEAGTLTGTTFASTDAEGRATFPAMTITGSAGQKTVRFSSGNLAPVSMSITLSAGAPAHLIKLTNDGQQVPAGGTASAAPSVRVVDEAYTPLAGVEVMFAIASGGGSLTGATATSDANGVATVGSWTVGGVMGEASVTASVPGADDVTFTATIVPGAPAVLEKYAGDNQSANVNTQVPIPLQVRVLDAFGNPVPERTVVFNVTSGGGLIVGPNGFTNALGIASIGDWTLGPTPGTNTARAVIGNLSATFTATGTAVPTP